ncbi:hypothetical protein C8R43DRAFT_442430 [Mycena crocata]|nr:hypothetical protein C8R43DRAFT_442430 [Mycena crocata]
MLRLFALQFTRSQQKNCSGNNCGSLKRSRPTSHSTNVSRTRTRARHRLRRGFASYFRLSLPPCCSHPRIPRVDIYVTIQISAFHPRVPICFFSVSAMPCTILSLSRIHHSRLPAHRHRSARIVASWDASWSENELICSISNALARLEEKSYF